MKIMAENDVQPRWLKLKQAAKYSSIGEKRLVVLATQGRIKGCQDPDSGRNDWIFDRLSIDAYRERQQPPKITPKQRAREIELSIYRRQKRLTF